MSEYTPTMERLRREYIEMREARFGFSDLYAEEWDRALAAHDAEVRVSVVPKESEVEWGTALRADNGTVWDEFWHISRADAEKEIAEDEPDDHTDDEIVLIRRRREIPAGPLEVVPWLPVKQEGE